MFAELHASNSTLLTIALILVILVAVFWLVGHRPWR